MQDNEKKEEQINNDDNNNELMQTNFDESVETFDELGLKSDLLRGIYGYGFEKPSIIQQKAILPIIKGRDVIAQAQSGTGKTAAFAIGTLQLIEQENDELQCLVLSPTRELAEQSQKVILALGDYMKVTAHCCVGGKSVDEDLKRFNHGTQIISGTPGRVYDMIQRKTFKTKNVKMLVIDEADEMLSKGFKEQVYDIYRYGYGKTW